MQRLAALPLGAMTAVVVGYAAMTGSPGWLVPGGGNDTPLRWATVATDVPNVRAAPTTDAAILGSFLEGDPVQVVGEPEAGFLPVRYGNERAWMAAQYLAFDGETFAASGNPVEVPDVSAAEQAHEPVGPVAAEAPVDDAPDPAPDVVGKPAERWIDIDRTTATVTLYEGDTALASFAGKIGRDPSADGYYSTATGTFHVYSMNKGLASTPFADDTYLTDWVGFDPARKNGIHSPVRDEFGTEKAWQNPATLGCVRLEADDAVAVFEFAEIGMRVEVHD